MKVTKQDIMRVAKMYFEPENRTVLYRRQTARSGATD